MVRSFIALFLVALLVGTALSQQKAEVTISLNEAFFDAALESLFQVGAPLEFSIAGTGLSRGEALAPKLVRASYGPTESSYSASPGLGGEDIECSETIKIQREINGVRTAVRFRDGKILAPLAFSGNYNPPFVGCVAFSGWAESVIDLEFDPNAQRLVARARVLNVNLNGTGGIGGSVVAKLVQSSIDKKVNPIELFQLNKLSFTVPVKGSELQMKAMGIRHELQNGSINVVVSYEFVR
ncbi:MAG: hypothetical protein PSX80_01705 [bacterium]|nr:hypothetical protein [bacterium]